MFIVANSNTAITDTGDLGIGTLIPTSNITVNVASSNSAIKIHQRGSGYAIEIVSGDIYLTGNILATGIVNGVSGVQGNNPFFRNALLNGNTSFNGGSTMYIDSVNDRVGLGKTDPGLPLDVVGAIRSTTTVRANVGMLVGANAVFHEGNDGSGSGLDAEFLSGNNSGFYTNSTNQTAGTLPSGRLSGSYTGITALGTLTGITSSGNVAIDTSTLWVDVNSNKVGIGRTDPSDTLDVVGTVNAATVNAKTSMFINGNQVWHSGNDGSGSGLDAGTLAGNNSGFYTNSINQTTGTLPSGRISGAYNGITGLGTLTDLAVSGNVVIDNTTFHVDSTGNKVSIGKLQPNSTLDVVGTANISTSISTGPGSVSAPSWYFFNDPTSGFYRIAANNWGLSLAGTKVVDFRTVGVDITGILTTSGNSAFDTNTLFVDVNSHKVAIGKTRPNSTLDVVGTINSTSQIYSDVGFKVGSNNVIHEGNLSLVTTIGTIGTLSVSGDSTLTGNVVVDTNVLLVDTVGNKVSIGKLQPNSTLDVVGTANISTSVSTGPGSVSAPSWYFFNDPTSGFYRIAANNWGLSLAGSKVVDFKTTGIDITGALTTTANAAFDTNVLLVDSVGNRVGIGKVQPNATLDIVGTANATGQIYSNVGFKVGTDTVWHSGNDGSGSGLDADLLDGNNSNFFTNTTNHTTGTTPSERLTGAYTGITGVGTLTSLAVSGNTTLSDQTQFNNGSVTSPAFKFVGASNTGFYVDSANTTESVTWASKGAPLLSIGQAAGTTQFDVRANNLTSLRLLNDALASNDTSRIRINGFANNSANVSTEIFRLNGSYNDITSGVESTILDGYVMDTGTIRNVISLVGGTSTGGNNRLDLLNGCLIRGAQAGSAAFPAYSFFGDPDTGIYRSAANKVAVAAGGSQVAEFSGTGLSVTGNVSATTIAANTANSADSNRVRLNSIEMVCFSVEIQNLNGVIQHRIGRPGNPSVATQLTSKIGNASTTYANTATGTDSSTDFTSGLKVSSAATNKLVFDVNQQNATNDAQNFHGIATIGVPNRANTAPGAVNAILTSRNVNGTTRTRLEVEFYHANGQSWVIGTNNIANANSVLVTIMGTLA